MQCPYCENEISYLSFHEEGQIEYGGNIKRDGWYSMQDNVRDYYCPYCFERLDTEDLNSLAVPNELR